VSPHLIDYTERIYVGGHDVTKETFAKAATVVKEAADQVIAEGVEAPTEFELLTAMAFWIFREEKVDYAVVEVGMGGLYDSTNVILPVVSIITNVAMDHMKYLGNTLEEIAHQKAGIIKTNPCSYRCAACCLEETQERSSRKGLQNLLLRKRL